MSDKVIPEILVLRPDFIEQLNEILELQAKLAREHGKCVLRVVMEVE